MDIKNISINNIVPYAKNQKKHDKKQIEQVANSIKRFGFIQPLVIDKDNNIVIGHCRYEASKILKKEEIPCVVVDNLTDEEVKALRIADNKLNESDWDMSLVIEELKGLNTDLIDLTGFSQDLIIEPEEKDDEVPETPEEPKSKLGDIYQLGEHRLMCGDSTNLESVDNLTNGFKADLIVTDPPYNTGMTGKKDEKAWLSQMFNDSFTDEQFENLITDVFNNYFTSSKGECAFYVFINWKYMDFIRKHLEKLMDVKNVIVWDKGVHGLGSDYKFTYEMCVVGKKGKPEINNRIGKDYQDIWRVQREMGRNEMHATVKPIELLIKPIKHASKQDDIVLDLFGGSGSTLIACDKTKRKCFMMELEPKYIDVIINRFHNYNPEAEIKCLNREFNIEEIWEKK